STGNVVLNVLQHPPRRVTRIIPAALLSPKSHIARHKANLGLRTESNKLGINPCFKVDANARICFFAPSKLPVVKKRPRREMKTSRPQQRAHPAAKCGSPAAKDGVR